MFISTRRYIQLTKLAFTDALTGCKTRNWWKHCYTPKKHNKKIDLAIIDVNNLKSINDNQGHLTGDRLICRVVDSCSKFGEVVRMGGDEFLVILKNTDKFIEYSKTQTDYAWGVEKDFVIHDSSFGSESLDKQMYTQKRESKEQDKFSTEMFNECEEFLKEDILLLEKLEQKSKSKVIRNNTKQNTKTSKKKKRNHKKIKK